MRIRKTIEEDVKRVMEIYAYARKFMDKTGNPNQWGPTNWPPEALIHDDIEKVDSYVCLNEESKVIGTFISYKVMTLNLRTVKLKTDPGLGL